MALTEATARSALPSGEERAVDLQPARRLPPARPPHTGWRSWVTTVDHKKIGIMYGAAALFFFLVGGIEALLIRVQLARPDGTLLSADAYNQVFTMHGMTMVFLVVMPMAAAFANYLHAAADRRPRRRLPPPERLRASGASCSAGSSSTSSWFLGGGADGGWFDYAPNTGVAFSPSHGIDFCALGLLITGIASLVSADQPDRHRAQHAGAGHDAHADAGVHLDDPGRRSSCCCSPCRSSPWRCSC